MKKRLRWLTALALVFTTLLVLWLPSTGCGRCKNYYLSIPAPQPLNIGDTNLTVDECAAAGCPGSFGTYALIGCENYEFDRTDGLSPLHEDQCEYGGTDKPDPGEDPKLVSSTHECGLPCSQSDSKTDYGSCIDVGAGVLACEHYNCRVI
jgi:hypothetical protein